MVTFKKLLPFFAFISTVFMLLTLNDSGHLYFLLSFTFFISVVCSWFYLRIYFDISPWFYNKEKKSKIGFKYAFLLCYVIVSWLLIIDNELSETRSLSFTNAKNYSCAHCDGIGERINQLTGKYGKCGTCKGTNQVSKQESGQYIKEYSNSNDPILNNSNVNSENAYPCPECSGLGLSTDVSENGMSQSQCVLCNGSGKVNQGVYESY